jgi:prevent-host-death family protein
MTTVSIKDAKNHFPRPIRAAENGETITVTRNGTPVTEITAVKKQNTGIDWDAGEAFLRKHGADRLVSWISPDFDDPLPEDFLIAPLPEDFDKPKPRRRK